jgi:hypothetical protein
MGNCRRRERAAALRPVDRDHRDGRRATRHDDAPYSRCLLLDRGCWRGLRCCRCPIRQRGQTRQLPARSPARNECSVPYEGVAEVAGGWQRKVCGLSAGGNRIRTCMGLFLSSGVLVCWRFFVRSGKVVLRPVACDQVRGAGGRGQGTETVAKLGGLPPSGACVSQRLET